MHRALRCAGVRCVVLCLTSQCPCLCLCSVHSYGGLPSSELIHVIPRRCTCLVLTRPFSSQLYVSFELVLVLVRVLAELVVVVLLLCASRLTSPMERHHYHLHLTYVPPADLPTDLPADLPADVPPVEMLPVHLLSADLPTAELLRADLALASEAARASVRDTCVGVLPMR